MKLGILTRYSDLGASSRLRFTQFAPFLEKAGYEILTDAFFDDDYLQRLYQGKKRKLAALCRYYNSRRKFLAALPAGIPLLIEYELFPHLPWFAERYFLKGHPYILNFDDAVDIHYEKLPILKNKYPQLIAHASGIICANELLKEKFSRYNSNILLLPTIPPAEIKPGKEKSDKLTLLWTGTPVTGKFLQERSKALQLAAERTPFRLLTVGCEINIPGVETAFIPWSETAEALALSQAHAGIMPLPDTPFARGKSAYKLICYLRAGIPGIASPVGANKQVIQNGINGFLVNSDREWAEAVARLNEPEVYGKLAAGALNAGKAFLPQDAAGNLLDFIQKNTFPPHK
jgi:glycosyltransferase involved in cell wall biosynthesis